MPTINHPADSYVTVETGAQGIDWTGDRRPRFSAGDDNTKYRIALDFTQPLLDKLGPQSRCTTGAAL